VALALCALYFSQGLVHGIGQVLVSQQAAAGASLETQADLLAWGALPWVFKFVWSLVWDRYLRRGEDSRRSRAIALASMQVGGGLALALFGMLGSSPWLPLLFFSMNLLISLQDVGTDALVVDAVPAAKRGTINSAMLSARALGQGLLGTLLFVKLMGSLGYRPTFFLFAAVLSALAALVALARRAPATATSSGGWPPLQALIATRGRRMGLMLAALAVNGDALSSAISYDFLIKKGEWDPTSLFTELAPPQYATEFLAYFVWMWLMPSIGGRRAVVLGSAGLALGWTGIALAESSWSSHGFMLGYSVYEISVRALMYTGVFTVLMGHTERERRATHFMIYMTLMNLPRVLEAAVAPRVFDAVSYSGTFMVCAGLSALTVGLMLWWRDADEAELL
jgi:MFS family permease